MGTPIWQVGDVRFAFSQYLEYTDAKPTFDEAYMPSEPRYMNASTRAVLAVILAALVGSGIFVALLPLGDACSFSDTPGVNCAVQSPLEQSFWNALAILLPVVVGAGAALAAGSRRHVAGIAASVLTILAAHFGARLAYGVATPNYELLATFVILLASAVLGLIGGHLSGYVVPHNKRMQRTRDG